MTEAQLDRYTEAALAAHNHVVRFSGHWDGVATDGLSYSTRGTSVTATLAWYRGAPTCLHTHRRGGKFVTDMARGYEALELFDEVTGADVLEVIGLEILLP